MNGKFFSKIAERELADIKTMIQNHRRKISIIESIGEFYNE